MNISFGEDVTHMTGLSSRPRKVDGAGPDLLGVEPPTGDYQLLSAVLGAAVAAEVHRQLAPLRAALAQAQAAATSAPAWVTPPAASRRTGVPVKTIRAMVRSGRISGRLRNLEAASKQPKYLVNVEDVARAAQMTSPSQHPESVLTGINEKAARIVARAAGR